MTKIFLGVAFCFFLAFAIGSCEPDSARNLRALQALGFTHIELNGHAWFACSDSDAFSTAFRAKNPQGSVVTGAVCCGYIKNCTVRF